MVTLSEDKTMLRFVVAMFMAAALAATAEAQYRAPIADKARAVVKALPRPIWTITRPGFVPVAKVARAAVHIASVLRLPKKQGQKAIARTSWPQNSPRPTDTQYQ